MQGEELLRCWTPEHVSGEARFAALPLQQDQASQRVIAMRVPNQVVQVCVKGH